MEPKTRLVLVRRKPYHSVIAHCVMVDFGSPQFGRHALRLLRVSPDHGPVPDTIIELYGKEYGTANLLRKAIIDKMKEATNGNTNKS